MNSPLSDEWLQRLGPLVLPFERRQFQVEIKQGEDIVFVDETINVSNKDTLLNITIASVEDIFQKKPIESKYLWLIDNEGLKLLPENIPNPYADRGVVCHTNITGGKPALQGGELWFGDDGNVYLNYKSGRYGANSVSQKLAIIDYFGYLGFQPVQVV